MTEPIKINEDNIYPRLIRASLILTTVLTVLGAAVFSIRFGLSILAGGLLAIANFYRMRQGLEAILNAQPANPTRYAIFKYVGRIALLALLLYGLIVYLKANVFGLILGLSVVVINIVIFSIYLSTRKGG